jgi:hypothetical protein
MKKLIITAMVGLALLLPATAQAHVQRQNYLPYKAALEQRYEFYADTFWGPLAHDQALNNLTDFDPYSNVWGPGAQEECCYVKALYGLMPDDGLDYSVRLSTVYTVGNVYCRPLSAATKAFLDPKLTAFDLRALYAPPILKLQPLVNQ